MPPTPAARVASYRRRRAALIEFLGGKCEGCGKCNKKAGRPATMPAEFKDEIEGG